MRSASFGQRPRWLLLLEFSCFSVSVAKTSSPMLLVQYKMVGVALALDLAQTPAAGWQPSGPLFSSLETGEACATQYSVTTHCLAGWEGASSWLSWLKQLFLLCMPTSSHHDHLLAQDFLGPFCA